MKRVGTFLLAALMCIGCTIPAFAVSDTGNVTSVLVADTVKRTEKNEVVFVREDVPKSEAVHDTSYNVNTVNAQLVVQETRATSWDVKGWSETAGYLAEIPCGSSAHVRNGKVLLTWHYTRTFLSDTFKYGDSGRKWGGDSSDGGVVVAKGSACDQDLWDLYVHHVYYGTED